MQPARICLPLVALPLIHEQCQQTAMADNPGCARGIPANTCDMMRCGCANRAPMSFLPAYPYTSWPYNRQLQQEQVDSYLRGIVHQQVDNNWQQLLLRQQHLQKELLVGRLMAADNLRCGRPHYMLPSTPLGEDCACYPTDFCCGLGGANALSDLACLRQYVRAALRDQCQCACARSMPMPDYCRRLPPIDKQQQASPQSKRRGSRRRSRKPSSDRPSSPAPSSSPAVVPVPLIVPSSSSSASTSTPSQSQSDKTSSTSSESEKVIGVGLLDTRSSSKSEPDQQDDDESPTSPAVASDEAEDEDEKKDEPSPKPSDEHSDTPGEEEEKEPAEPSDEQEDKRSQQETGHDDDNSPKPSASRSHSANSDADAVNQPDNKQPDDSSAEAHSPTKRPNTA